MIMDRDLEIFTKAIEKYGKESQTMMAIEEMSELIKELSKDYRGYDNRTSIIEEVVDVVIMILQLTIIFNINEKEFFSKYIEKLNRLEDRLNG